MKGIYFMKTEKKILASIRMILTIVMIAIITLKCAGDYDSEAKNNPKDNTQTEDNTNPVTKDFGANCYIGTLGAELAKTFFLERAYKVHCIPGSKGPDINTTDETNMSLWTTNLYGMTKGECEWYFRQRLFVVQSHVGSIDCRDGVSTCEGSFYNWTDYFISYYGCAVGQSGHYYNDNDTCGKPDIQILQGSTSIPDGGNFSFGTAYINHTSSSQFTIKNTGRKVLNINSVYVNGTNSNEFSTSGISTPATLSANSSKNFNVSFKPLSEGNKNATLHIISDDQDESDYNISIQGYASVASDMGIFYNGAEIVSNSTYNFGKSGIGKSNTITFIIKNLGNTFLNFTGNPKVIVANGSETNTFTSTQPGVSSLNPGESVNFDVTFVPASFGSKSGTIWIKYNNPDFYIINLQGLGCDPRPCAPNTCIECSLNTCP
jgi:hypothetical protein